MTQLLYATTADVRDGLDITEASYADPQILRALGAATESVYGIVKRRFHPEVTTKKFDWPTPQTAETWRVWLYASDLWRLDSLTSGGTPIPTTDVILEPQWEGPPYTSLQIRLSGHSSLQAGSTWQQAVEIAGMWGYLGEIDPTTTLTTALTAGATTITAATSTGISAGATLTIDSEILAVTGRSSALAGTSLTGTVDADESDVLLAVTDTGAVTPGELITIDAERMQVVDVTTGLVVRRAVQGSVLTSHTTGTAVYADRSWTVARGMGGTTPAAHAPSSVVSRVRAPQLVEAYTVAAALRTLQGQRSGYTTMARTDDTSTQVRQSSSGLTELRDDLYGTYGRQARTRVV